MGKLLAPLFEADRVAIIGASERNHYAATIFRNLQGLGFDLSRIIPVNPNRPEAFGLKAYPTVLDVPEEIPLAIVATPAKTVLSIVEQLGEKKVKAAIVLADGFREAGEEGKALQQQLTQAARKRGLQLVGPNCMGLVSVRHRLGLWGGELPRSLKTGNIACVFQSSGMFNLFLNLLSERGMGLHIGVSGGNEAVLNAADYLEYAAGCAEVDVIAMFMEAATEAQKLIHGLDLALANGKGVIVQPQLRGVECLLGISRDPQLGPVLALGLGGVWVEVLKDIAVRIPPITQAEARRALEGLRGQAILHGVRSAPAADIEALSEMASRLSWLAHDLGDQVKELDLNPVLVLPAGWMPWL